MVYFHVGMFIVGLVLLVKGSDFFVEAASRIAKKLGVTEFVIGLTLVALGTSIPELASSVVASFRQYDSLIIGNIVGSNIANIGLIIGVTATVSVVKAKRHMLRRDGYIMLFVSFVFYLLMLNGVLSRLESVLFLLLYVAYISFLFRSRAELKKWQFREFLRYFLRFHYLWVLRDGILNNIKKINGFSRSTLLQYLTEQKTLFKDFIIIIFSGFAIAYGARFLVNEAVWFAEFFNVSAGIIGLSAVAIGTSLPELGVSITAARKGFGFMILGNIIGSNVANLLLIGGVAALINPLDISHFDMLYTAPFMLIMSILLLVFIKSRWKIRRTEAFVFITLYLLFLLFLFFKQTV